MLNIISYNQLQMIMKERDQFMIAFHSFLKPPFPPKKWGINTMPLK